MKAFTDKEKQFVTEALMQKGKERFAAFGIKKTTVEDLTQSVNIAKGSFYLFFDSKEDLYFRNLMQEKRKNPGGGPVDGRH